MKVDFKEIKESDLFNFKGGKNHLVARLFEDKNGKIMRGTLLPGASIGLHDHQTSSEYVYILKGNGLAVCDGVEEELHCGEVHFCPKGSSHSVINESDENLEFLAVIPNL